MSQILKALTVLQPWATALALRTKRIETRSWRTDYRGPLLIHAGKSSEFMDCDPGADLEFIGAPAHRPIFSMSRWPDSLMPLGAIVAIGRLSACVPTGHQHEDFKRLLTARELDLGDFSPGRFGWVLADVKPLPRPIPCSGKQGLWNADPAQISGLAEALKELGVQS